MNNFKIGDLVGLQHPSEHRIIKTGIVIYQGLDGFNVKWTSYDKSFFMEKEDVIFEELNKLYLLSTQYFKYNNAYTHLSLINAS